MLGFKGFKEKFEGKIRKRGIFYFSDIGVLRMKGVERGVGDDIEVVVLLVVIFGFLLCFSKGC